MSWTRADTAMAAAAVALAATLARQPGVLLLGILVCSTFTAWACSWRCMSVPRGLVKGGQGRGGRHG